MSILDKKAKEFEESFISIQSVLELFLQDGNENEHIKHTMNATFFKQQTCLVRDGYSATVIKINNETAPTYQQIKSAIGAYLDKNLCGEMISDYGFSKKRTLTYLAQMGMNVYDQLLQAKSFIPCDDDYNGDDEPLRECLPHEYKLLYDSYEKIKAENEGLKTQLQSNKPDIPNVQGDALLVLGAVMECIKSVAKPNYTQSMLIENILEKYSHVSSISESTLTKQFTASKTYLKQNQ